MSPNESVQHLWKSSSNHTNVQYDVYKSTKDVIKDFHADHEYKLKNHLVSQGSFFSNVLSNSLLKLSSIWSSAQSSLPKNIFNFTIRYINNTLPTRKNLSKWGLSPTSDCSFCLKPESLLHVIAGCKTYLDQGRFTWRHDSILHFIATTLQAVNGSSLHADIPGFNSPSILTGDSQRPDLILCTTNDCLYVLELTAGFESNLQNNITRKRAKYKETVNNLCHYHKKVVFVNLSVSALGVFAKDSESFFTMLDELCFDSKHQKYIIKTITKIAIRSSYYIFCCRNKSWNDPELMKF